jgi:hypothetical protein
VRQTISERKGAPEAQHLSISTPQKRKSATHISWTTHGPLVRSTLVTLVTLSRASIRLSTLFQSFSGGLNWLSSPRGGGGACAQLQWRSRNQRNRTGIRSSSTYRLGILSPLLPNLLCLCTTMTLFISPSPLSPN